MAYAYQELKKKTVQELREIAKDLKDDPPPCSVTFIPEGKYTPYTLFSSAVTTPLVKSDAR